MKSAINRLISPDSFKEFSAAAFVLIYLTVGGVIKLSFSVVKFIFAVYAGGGSNSTRDNNPEDANEGLVYYTYFDPNGPGQN